MIKNILIRRKESNTSCSAEEGHSAGWKLHILSTFIVTYILQRCLLTVASSLLIFIFFIILSLSLYLSHATESVANLTPSTSPPNHSLALTPTCPIPFVLLLIANPSTWCPNSNVWSAMSFTLEKRIRYPQNMNGHQSTCTIMYFDLLVPTHTKSHQLSFREFSSGCVIHKLSYAICDYVCCQFEMA